VAPVGSSFVGDDGETIQVKRTVVGGVASEGVLCDSHMLGWSGGAKGVAVQIPASVEVGSSPPPTKPRPKGGGGSEAQAPAQEVKGLFEKKLTKEEKKKLAEERKRARKEAKDKAIP